MSNFQAPPTWAELILVNRATGVSTFNPIWLNWFISLTQNIGVTGPVTSVTASAPLASSGGVSPNITVSAIPNTSLDTMPANTVKANNTGGVATPVNATVAQILTMLGLNGGLSATITTAKLTPGGANGSMTFTIGILTASTPAT